MPFAGYKDFDDCVKKNSDKEDPKAYCAQIQRKAEEDEKDKAMFEVIGDKFYATARAQIVSGPQDLPREMASEFTMDRTNPSFIWIAGRYVQADNLNKNGHFWSFDDLKAGEKSITHTPVNALHEWDKPIGTIVQTKMVQREAADDGLAFPEIQALSVVWGANFPEVAQLIKKAHADKELFYSMECVAESKQCLQCEQVFDYATAALDTCEHMAAEANAPRRFINPTFLGGALIFPPDKPAWPEAEITEVARLLTREYANRDDEVSRWEAAMDAVIQLSET